MTWAQIKDRFESMNPVLRAGVLGIDETRTGEVAAYLRPNPSMTITADQLDPFTLHPLRPLYNALPAGSVSYLHEREHKRELRLDSARRATEIAVEQQSDLERNLLFALKNAFVQLLQAKSVLAMARDNLNYYDDFLRISRDRLQAGDIAQSDLDRLELERVQYESDLQSAEVNLHTAKIQLLVALDDHTPIDSFDVTGRFDFDDHIPTLAELRQSALEARPDLKAAIASIDKARVDHQLAIANGTADPTFSVDAGRNPPLDHYVGVSISVPLRLFDRNQAEKTRTELDIKRNEQLREATAAQVFGDVDSAYSLLVSSLTLLHPYKEKYLRQAARVRDTVTFSYQHGGASLVDFLGAENSYRSIQLNYLNLVASYLTAANQLNLAVGRDVMP